MDDPLDAVAGIITHDITHPILFLYLGTNTSIRFIDQQLPYH